MKAFGSFFLFLLAIATAAVLFFSPVGKTVIHLATAKAQSGLEVTSQAPVVVETTQPVNPEFAAVVSEATGQPLVAVSAQAPAATDSMTAVSAPAPDAADSITAVNAPAPDTDSGGLFSAAPGPSAVPAKIPAPLAAVNAAPETIEELAKQPKSWPQAVFLTKGFTFPVVMNGRALGSADVPAGTRVKLIAVQPDKTVTVDFNGGRLVINASDTDLARQLKPGANKVEPKIISAQVLE